MSMEEMSYQHMCAFVQCNFIIQAFGEPELMFDIGSGVYSHEVWYLKEGWPNCKIVGFEPSKARYDQLKDRYPGELINSAVANHKGKIALYEDDNDGCLNLEKRNNTTKIEVQCDTLDNISLNYGNLNNVFIWADIEGSEIYLLEGAKRMLSNGIISGLNLELQFKSNFGWEFDDSAIEIINFLESYGYEYGGPLVKFLTGHADVVFGKIK